MRLCHQSIRIVSLGLALCCKHCVFAAEDLGKCVTALVLPTASVLSRNASTGGTVTADVTVGSQGQASSVDLAGPNYNLKAEVDVQIRQSKFSPTCVGKKLRFSFQFQFEGEPTVDRLPPRVIYKSPRSFVIVLRPGKSIVD